MEQFDLAIIGGGPAGYAGLMRAIDFGKKVCLIEKSEIGGAGVRNGALSSKTLWELSERFLTTKETLHSNGKLSFDNTWSHAQQGAESVVETRIAQLHYQIDVLCKQYPDQIVLKKGTAEFESNTVLHIHSENGSEKIEAQFILIATGSSPRKLPNIPIDEEHILTSDGISKLTEFPKSLVILGAGVIGCEFATIFSNFGKTKVFLIDRANRVLPFEDQDVSDMVAENLRKNNVVIHNEAQFKGMEVIKGQVQYEIQYPQGMQQLIRVEKALVSVGRIPNTQHLGLEKLGVNLSPTGHIINQDTQTNIPNIFAAGDVSGHMALVNVGEIEARHAVEKMFGSSGEALSYDNLCTIMFLHPEVASIGFN